MVASVAWWNLPGRSCLTVLPGQFTGRTKLLGWENTVTFVERHDYANDSCHFLVIWNGYNSAAFVTDRFKVVLPSFSYIVSVFCLCVSIFVLWYVYRPLYTVHLLYFCHDGVYVALRFVRYSKRVSKCFIIVKCALQIINHVVYMAYMINYS